MEGIWVPPWPADEGVFLPEKFYDQQLSDVHIRGKQERHGGVCVQSRPVESKTISITFSVISAQHGVQSEAKHGLK